MSASASMAKSKILNEEVMALAKAPASVAKKVADQAAPQSAIQQNPFYQTLFSPDMAPEEKIEAVKAMLTTTLDRAKDSANIKALNEFREWLSNQQITLAEQVIALTNVESMAELQAIIQEMNTDLIDFEDRMNPLLNIIESIHYLRTKGLMDDSFRKLEEDRAREEQTKQDILDLEQSLRDYEDLIKRKREEKADASTQRSFFGLGGVTKDAQRTMTLCDDAIAEAKENSEKASAKITDLENSLAVIPGDDEAAIHRARLRELLDMSKDENVDKLVGLRDAGQKFIDTSRERSGSLRGQFTKLHQQLETANTNTDNMQDTYAILNDGIKGAQIENIASRDNLKTAPEDESTIAKASRERKLRDLDSHVDHLTTMQGEAMAVSGQLAQQAIRVHTMRQATIQQMDNTRKMNTDTTASVADHIAMATTSITAAALSEGGAQVQDAMNRLKTVTQGIGNSQVVANAMQRSRVTKELETLFENLDSMNEVVQAATGISRNTQTEMLEKVHALKEMSQTSRQDLDALIGVSSDVQAEDQGSASTAAAANAAAATVDNNLFPQV